jgi:hypothetical protein
MRPRPAGTQVTQPVAEAAGAPAATINTAGRGPNPILWAYGVTSLRPLCPVHRVELEEPWLRCPRCEQRANVEPE